MTSPPNIVLWFVCLWVICRCAWRAFVAFEAIRDAMEAEEHRRKVEGERK